MKKIKYLLKVIKSFNYGKMLKMVGAVSRKTGKLKIVVFFDMIYCGIKYQAGYIDYDLFQMYKLNKKQRKTIVTRGINASFIRRFNNPKYTKLIANKISFNKIFSKYLGRKWLDIDNCSKEEYDNFIKGLTEIMLKPSEGSCGKGIEKISLKNRDLNVFYTEIKNKKNYLLEEVVKQNKTMGKLHPYSINTCRVVSILKNNEVNIVATYLRIGNGKFVDNFNSGGMVVPVDKDTGIIKYPALDKKGNLYERHPLTKVKINGFKIPFFKEALALVKEAGLLIPEVGIIGWDVCISNKGPLFIEANDFPGHDIYQLPPHRKDGIGMLPEFEKIINKK